MPLKPTQSADDGGVFGEQAVTGQRREIGDQSVDVIDAMRAFGMAGNLCFLPRSQFRVQLVDLFFDLFLQTADFFGDADAFLRLTEVAQPLDFAFQFGDGFFKFQILFLFHGDPAC